MANVQFQDNSARVMAALDDACIAYLHEAAGELESQTKRNTKVSSGQLKNSWTYKVNESKGEAAIGSPLENAIWEEFGTGTEALNGNGRKDVPWVYRSEDGKWHRTKGKKPSRALKLASDNIDSLIKEYFKERFKNL